MFKDLKEFLKFGKKDSNIQDVAKSNMKFFQWVQEYSKKIVTITFYIFVIGEILCLGLILLAYYQMGELMFVDTFIMENNQTFRDVIGGYIIKAACENAIKIAGGVVDRYLTFKADQMEKERTHQENFPSSGGKDNIDRSNNISVNINQEQQSMDDPEDPIGGINPEDYPAG